MCWNYTIKKKCEICGQMYEASISTLNFYNKMNICNKCLCLKNKYKKSNFLGI